MHLRIGTPMYGGNCKGIYVDSLMGLSFELAKMGHMVSFTKIFNESLITRARNNIVYDFMESDADALLFIDADEGFNVQDVIKMIESGKDLIGGIYPMKNINWDTVRRAALSGEEDLAKYSGFFALNMLPGETTFNLQDPVPVTEVATGLMYITRKVFEDLEPHCPKYALNGVDAQFDMEKMVTEYFATSIDEGILLSEDYHFCRKYRSIGGEVFAAPWVSVVHAGDYIFSGNFAQTIQLGGAVSNVVAKAAVEEDSSQSSDTIDDHSE